MQQTRTDKKTLASFMVIVMIWLLLPFSAYGANSGSCGDGVNYSYDSSTKVLTISGSGVVYDYDTPSDSPLNGLGTIKTVCIKKGVTALGTNSLESRTDFSNLYLFGNITLKENCFSGNNSVQNVIIGKDVTTVTTQETTFLNLKKTIILGNTLTVNTDYTDVSPSNGLYNFYGKNNMNLTVYVNGSGGKQSIDMRYVLCTTVDSYNNGKGVTNIEEFDDYFNSYNKHSFSVKDTATCEGAGTKTSTCTLCGFVKTEKSAAKGHRFASNEPYCLNGCGKKNENYTPDDDSSESESIYPGELSTNYADFRVLPCVGSLKVAWTGDEKIDFYEIYISSDGKNYKWLADVDIAEQNYYLITGLNSGSKYYVKIHGYLTYNEERIDMENESSPEVVRVR